MNWELIKLFSQVATALAVLATLAYLASQNKLASGAAASNATIRATELAGHWRGMVVNDAGLADALTKANADEGVTPGEQLRLNLLYDDLFILAGAAQEDSIRSGALHDI